ncbi:hypothetical protein GGX14DRAFT_396315 [Mycena pura]|uniref:Uncharacterized protein n=1 Tax=Mycena pura TaxID=153505 RepID=A0AAD6VCL9_9AGAR|nr:hypothetical protein GGX14DRAFT_396315 [Mycena pura]
MSASSRITIKIKERTILDGIFEVYGAKIRPISSAVDKLDKAGFRSCRVQLHLQLPWPEVKKEMTGEKGLDEATADKIGEYINLKGSILHYYMCSHRCCSRHGYRLGVLQR